MAAPRSRHQHAGSVPVAGYCGAVDDIGGVDEVELVLPGDVVPPGDIEPLLIDPLVLDPERCERLCEVVEEVLVPLVGDPLLIVSPLIVPPLIEPLGAVVPMPGDVLVDVPGVAPVPADPGAPPVPAIWALAAVASKAAVIAITIFMVCLLLV